VGAYGDKAGAKCQCSTLCMYYAAFHLAGKATTRSISASTGRAASRLDSLRVMSSHTLLEQRLSMPQFFALTEQIATARHLKHGIAAIADAADTAGVDPDRGSFTIALHTARDQLIQASNIIADTKADLTGAIGRQVLAQLMLNRPSAATAASSIAPSPNTRHAGPNPNRSNYPAAIAILTGPR
jgi:hypothetical protein